MTTIHSPLVSVIIPCYQQAHFLGEAIDSVLAQTYPHREIIVVDDGSPDNTAEVAASYSGVRYIRQENQGLSAARNTGLHASTGDYLVFLDADDRLLPHALETGVEQLEAHPECAFTAGPCALIAADGSPLTTPDQPLNAYEPYLTLLRRNVIWNPASVMYRPAIFDIVGEFDVVLSPAADYDLYLRITREHPVHWHSTVIAEYRQHATAMSANPSRMLRSVMTVLRRQWKHVRTHKVRRDAYECGLHHWHALYGEPLVDAACHHAARREWPQVIQSLQVLQRYYPQGFTSVMELGWLHSPSFAARYDSSPPTRWRAGETHPYTVNIINTGARTWFAEGLNIVRLGVHFGTTSNSPHEGWVTDQRFQLPTTVPPGASAMLRVRVTAPGPGNYVLRHRLVKEGITWFDQIEKIDVAVS